MTFRKVICLSWPATSQNDTFEKKEHLQQGSKESKYQPWPPDPKSTTEVKQEDGTSNTHNFVATILGFLGVFFLSFWAQKLLHCLGHQPFKFLFSFFQLHPFFLTAGVLERGDVCVLRAAEKVDGFGPGFLGSPLLMFSIISSRPDPIWGNGLSLKRDTQRRDFNPRTFCKQFLLWWQAYLSIILIATNVVPCKAWIE